MGIAETGPFGVRIDDRAGAATRQKSCNACVRGKRRCDKRAPRCTRCVAKGLDCVYQRIPPGASSASLSASISAAAPAGGAGAATPTLDEAPDFDMSLDVDSLATDTSPESLHNQADVSLLAAGAAPALDFSILDLLNSPAPGSDLWSMPGFYDAGGHGDGTTKMDLAPLPTAPPSMQPASPRRPIRDVSLLTECSKDGCLGVDPLQVHDPRSRIGYIVVFLTSLAATFARTRALPFLHARLWASQLPRPILAAFSAATAYVACSPQNKAWTLRLVAEAAREIHREGAAAATPPDKLARVQALTVVQCIRFFDGDVGLRVAAERDEGLLLAWLEELQAVKEELEWEARKQLGELDKVLPKSWESWVFLESTRRSILAGYSFVCLLYLLKSQEPNCDSWTKCQSFTASRHLWEAASSVEFYRAWRERPQFWIEKLVFKDFWMYGRPADLDDFTRLILTTQVGVDAMDHFMEGDTAIPV